MDDVYDTDCAPCGTVTGVTIIPTNTDGGSNPDYTDLDSDDDGENDILEGHDLNGNGIIDGTENGPVNADADGDGLDDGF